MRTRANFCDVCAPDGEVRLAAGTYYSVEVGKYFDACTTHLREIKKYVDDDDSMLRMGEEFENPGNVSDDLFYQ